MRFIEIRMNATDMHIHKRTTDETCYIMPLTETVQVFVVQTEHNSWLCKTNSVNDKKIAVYKVSENMKVANLADVHSKKVCLCLCFWPFDIRVVKDCTPKEFLKPCQNPSERVSNHVVYIDLVMMLMKRASQESRIINTASPSLHMHLHSCLWRRLTHHL